MLRKKTKTSLLNAKQRETPTTSLQNAKKPSKRKTKTAFKTPQNSLKIAKTKNNNNKNSPPTLAFKTPLKKHHETALKSLKRKNQQQKTLPLPEK